MSFYLGAVPIAQYVPFKPLTNVQRSSIINRNIQYVNGMVRDSLILQNIMKKAVQGQVFDEGMAFAALDRLKQEIEHFSF